MKTGAYTGYCDKGYKRYKNHENSDRKINGLVQCGSTGEVPPIIPPPADKVFVMHGGDFVFHGEDLVVYTQGVH